MWFQEIKKYIGIFILGVALVAVYKTFDNFDRLIEWAKMVLSLLTPLGIGFCISYILYAPCRKIECSLQKTNLPVVIRYRRGIAVGVIYLLFAGTLTLLMVAIIPALIKSVKEFMEQLPNIIRGAVDWFNSLGIYTVQDRALQTFVSEQILSMDNLLNGITFDNVNRYAKGVMTFGTAVFNVFLGAIISIYLLADRTDLKTITLRVIRSFVPKQQYKFFGKYISKIHEFIQLYISCQLLDALIVFLLSFFALGVLKVKYTPLLAFLVGALNLIPYFGAITATVIASVITVFTKSFSAGLVVAITLTVLQQLDANFIQPRLVSGSLNVKPLWVILGIMVGGGLFGVLGIFLAVPVLALVRIVLLDLLDTREKQLLMQAEAGEEKPN